MLLSDTFNRLGELEDSDQAVIVKLDGKWFFVIGLEFNTKYFYTASLTNDGTVKHETLQRDMPVMIISPDQAKEYGLE